jgi:alkylation response protein AidB-like acyl-CoA dehydrogenase
LTHYKSNLRDVRFNLFELLGRDEILGTGPYEEMDRETADAVLDEVDHLVKTRLADSFAQSDQQPPVFDAEQHAVAIPAAFRRSYQAYMDSGFEALGLPAELGGQPAPLSLQWSVNELILGANPAVYMYASGPKFSSVLWNNGTAEQRRIAQIMFDRQWSATMVLTEPDAGSDVGAGRTKAYPQPDGSWHLEGVKRFITSAEHDMSDRAPCRPGSAARAPRGCPCSSCPSTTSTTRPASSPGSATASTPPGSSTRWGSRSPPRAS